MKKLRHKVTREIAVFAGVEIKDDRVFFRFEDERGIFKMKINSLDELNEWEDYEEPETYYYISDCVNIESLTNGHGCNLPEEIWHKAIERRKEIGNYFETRDEAEKALEKLKAWKRLKDKGFKFTGFTRHGDEIAMRAVLYDDGVLGMIEDLDLIFGGEE